MKSSRQSRRDARTLFRACQRDGVLDEARVRDAVARVVAAKPRGFAGLLAEFQCLVRLDVERRSARIENAVETSPEQQRALEAALAKRYGPGLNVTYWINPALIGGLRVKVGSDIFDGSVAGHLADLRSKL
jgi:F-type H+-transporting ATPase subunit delta